MSFKFTDLLKKQREENEISLKDAAAKGTMAVLVATLYFSLAMPIAEAGYQNGLNLKERAAKIEQIKTGVANVSYQKHDVKVNVGGFTSPSGEGVDNVAANIEIKDKRTGEEVSAVFNCSDTAVDGNKMIVTSTSTPKKVDITRFENVRVCALGVQTTVENLRVLAAKDKAPEDQQRKIEKIIRIAEELSSPKSESFKAPESKVASKLKM